MKVKGTDNAKKKVKKLKGLANNVKSKQYISSELKTEVINFLDHEQKKAKKQVKTAKANAISTVENFDIETVHVDESKELSAAMENEVTRTKLKKKKKNSNKKAEVNVESKKTNKTKNQSPDDKKNQNNFKKIRKNESTSKKNKKSEVIENEVEMEVDINQLPSEDSETESEDENELKNKIALKNQNEAREKIKSRKSFVPCFITSTNKNINNFIIIVPK